jgi:Tfp pilus tip-associated adhesin PilY1
MTRRLYHLAGLALWMASALASADDKDLLKGGAAPPNLMIVFGNSQTTAATMTNLVSTATSTWDGDADSTASKLGAAKQVVKQFVNARHTTFNIGLTTFAHNPNAGSITISGKHWLYSPIGTAAGGAGAVDFPTESWKEPIGTIERWGENGEGPCTNKTVPVCTDRSPNFITLPAAASVTGPFFGLTGTGSAIIKLSATTQVLVTLTAGKYGDAYTDGSLSAYTISTPAPAHSMTVTKQYQKKVGSSFVTQALTPGGDPGTVTVYYVPSSTLTSDLFYTTKAGSITTPCVVGDPNCGNEIGFLNDPQGNFSVSANCSGWEFQVNSNPQPLIKVPRDYKWGAACQPPQDSFPCVSRLLRPQAKLVAYDQTSGAFTTTDPDNPGYTGAGSKYADGCDSTLLGGVDAGLDITENQAVLTTRNGSQAPIKNLLTNIYEYFTKSAIDGFQNGKRLDDPNKACRKSGVVLIYDNFNGCQNDNCSFLTSFILTKFKQINVPVYVIGFGASATATSNTGICIAHNSGAILPDGTDGYFPVTDTAGLMQALIDISDLLDESSQTFATAAVSTSQALGDQMAYFASFSASKKRSIWNGRLGGYKLDATTGNIQIGQYTINDPNDPNNGATIPVPSNDPSSLIWNVGANLLQTYPASGQTGSGATDSTKILAPGATLSTGSYSDDSNDTVSTIPTHFYPGRKIVFSLPQGYTSPVTTLPIAAGNAVPETRNDLTYTTGATWWPDLKALLAPQTGAPGPPGPALTDTDAGNTLRFIWGDRDAVTGATDASRKYFGQKLGDIFHSGPLLIGGPSDFALFKTNVQNYAAFASAYKNRRRVIYVGANDGLLHAFEAGILGRDSSKPSAYDLGTGAELFAFAPRAIMQIYKPLKDAVGAQTKQDEWTVDLSPSAADAFIDANHSGTPVAGNRAWHTVLVGGVREGSPFEGTSGAAPQNSQGSYFALDITQPDELVSGVESTGGNTAPKCLNKSGDATCSRDWPTVLWEITDTTDLDASGSGLGYPDMGETWAKASMGRVKICTANCGNTSAPLPTVEDHYVAIFGGGFDRERLNRRGNWIYMVDIETGKALYKVNSGTADFGSGPVTVNFGSIPSEPAALDYNDDSILDLIYVGDQKGQLWRIDLTDLRMLASPPGGSFNNQLDLAAGSGTPFLFFQAPQPTSPATTPFYPIYYRPEGIVLGYNVGGRPALGIAFGTGDRDDIQGKADTSSLTYKQRFYYVIDAANTTTTTESTSGMLNIASPTAPAASSVPVKGWFLQLTNGERVVGDSLAPGGVIRFPTYNPISSTPGSDPCANPVKCSAAAGTSRQYQVYYNTGDAYLGASDRGQTQTSAMFITAATSYLTGGSDAHGVFWSGGVSNPALGIGRKITVRSWKEKASRP